MSELPNPHDTARLAESHRNAHVIRSATPVLLEDLTGFQKSLRATYEDMRTTPADERALPFVAEWLLDNFYLVERAFRQIDEDMPAAYYRRLPQLEEDEQPIPRMYAIARYLVRYHRGRLDVGQLADFMMAYQKTTPLTIGELWALPTMLRIALLEFLVDTLAGKSPASQPNGGDTAAIVGQSILGLRTIDTQDWNDFFEMVSAVDQVLRRDPAQVYSTMDFDTRDQYRRVVEILALGSKQPEAQIAAAAIELAEQALAVPDSSYPSARSHVGFYLVGSGQPTLETAVGYRPPLRARLLRFIHQAGVPLYIGSITLITLLLSGAVLLTADYAGGDLGDLLLAALLSLIPASSIGVGLVNWLVTRILPPTDLPKLDFSDGIPDAQRALVVVPVLLRTPAEVRDSLRKLEQRLFGNQDPNLSFALLTDFADAENETMPADAELLEIAIEGIRNLNQQHATNGFEPFLLLHRKRTWNDAEGRWLGWERKRGKLEQLNNRILGHSGPFDVEIGDLESRLPIAYVITLDDDTELPGGAAQRLVGTMAHPLNRPVYDLDDRRVVAGYTILQPRVEIVPAQSTRSIFTRAYASDSALDLYSRAVSDAYQDLFGEGIFVGKGIYDVRAFHELLGDRVPENALLSHDLFEGIHSRAGLVSDIVLYESFPPDYLSYASRLHRWVRGDWQLLPWLLGDGPRAAASCEASPLSLLSRWKIFDNLRRSLYAPTLLVFFVLGWLVLPGSALAWTAIGVALSFSNLLTAGLQLLPDMLNNIGAEHTQQPLSLAARRWLLSIIFLPYEAYLAMDAILKTLVRVTITHRRMLQWTTAAHTASLLGRRASSMLFLWVEMASSTLSSIGIAALLVFLRPAALPVAAVFLLQWLAAPLIAALISRPITSDIPPLTQDQRDLLRHLARRTWHYFVDFIVPEDNWLPPDHFQEEPNGTVAHRTSPTNLGMALLSMLAAYDLGFVTLNTLLIRLGNTLNTMERLDRFRGHFLNWYDTRTLEPLAPRYVSTVDSGNLVACLITLRQGLDGLLDQPVLRPQEWLGLIDTLETVKEACLQRWVAIGAERSARISEILDSMQDTLRTTASSPLTWSRSLEKLIENDLLTASALLADLISEKPDALRSKQLEEIETWFYHVGEELEDLEHSLNEYMPWSAELETPPQLFESLDAAPHILDYWQGLYSALQNPPLVRAGADYCSSCISLLDQLSAAIAKELDALPAGQSSPRAEQLRQAAEWCRRVARHVEESSLNMQRLRENLESLSQSSRTLAAADFAILFDPQRKVFRIGYNLDTVSEDPNHYDLLASEARFASIVAISRDEVPQKHWLHLARPITRVNGMRALLSWSGTMFEYLMPALLMRSSPDTLISQTNRVIIAEQIRYARRRGTPWGISESGYYRFDNAQNYQYQAFGVPTLAFKRGLRDYHVITPYASLLALPYRPQAVVENVIRLQRQGMLGEYGLYEAADYTHRQNPTGRRFATVQSFMVHHQAMSLIAITNALRNDVMVQRFTSDPRIQAVGLLLEEQVPFQAPLEFPERTPAPVHQAPESTADIIPSWQPDPRSPVPQTHVLSNGRYGLIITASGAGYSTWHDVNLTRWRPDTTRDNWGSWIYIRDNETGSLWSATRQPTPAPAATYETAYHTHMAEFVCRNNGISLRTEILVSPEHDVEIRRVSISNDTDRPRSLVLLNYAEVSLAPAGDDERHPAFAKLFVESEYIAEVNGLLFRRRPRSAEEKPVVLLHSLVPPPGQKPTRTYDTDRGRFLGRNGSIAYPAALAGARPALSGTTGATLDPVIAHGQEIELQPHTATRVAFISAAAEYREQALELTRQLNTWTSIDQILTHSQLDFDRGVRQIGLDSPQLIRAQRILSFLLYPVGALRASPHTMASNTLWQSGLWGFAVSGDYPIALVQVYKKDQLPLIREMLAMHAFWRSREVTIDLIVVNEREEGYDQELHRQIMGLLAETHSDEYLNQRGGVFVLRSTQISPESRVLLETSAQVILDGDTGSVAENLRRVPLLAAPLPVFEPLPAPGVIPAETPVLARPEDLLFDNEYGGFDPSGREYHIYLPPGKHTPAPWINVVANPESGFIVSESGTGYTWAGNSGENRLTTWHNDPVLDTSGEALYLRDEETAAVWSPTPAPMPADAPYLVRHGAGYSTFELSAHGLTHQLDMFVAPAAPVKIYHLQLRNTWQRARRLTVTFYAEWVLGTTRAATQQTIAPEFDAGSNGMLVRNVTSPDFRDGVAFAAADRQLHGITADRTEFLGRHGSQQRPAALQRVGLTGKVEAGLDPCAALQIHVELEPGAEEEIVFVIGQGDNHEDARRLINHFAGAATARETREAVVQRWDEILGTVQVETPELALNIVLNRWLLYQALSCRIWGRSALYQSSGAYGFRDQLQDVMALLHARPDLAREHIVRAAGHQFAEGDVLHWWHPPADRGVRTRISDDLLWLPYVTAHYIATTGDESILDEPVRYLDAAPLAAEEDERYAQYTAATEEFPIYDHCIRAIQRGATASERDLPLIGHGDWNDGMNRVGVDGRGESIWLGWFLIDVLNRFAPIAERRDDPSIAEEFRQRAEALRAALEEHAWDGDWYIRATYDDGAPLGSKTSEECQIDAIAQSWSVLSGAARPERAERAMAAASRRLIREDDGLIALLTPPFDNTARDPGYIKGYVPGIRENGGQYTHAAIWTAWAFAKLGDGDRASELFNLLNPITHTLNKQDCERYKVEPYVIVADVYSNEQHVGRGGWTWYTGSSGWMYRLGLEAILGIYRRGNQLHIAPAIPGTWESYTIVYRYGHAVYRLQIENPDGVTHGVRSLILDGESLTDPWIPLRDDDQEHSVRVVLG